MFAAYRDDNMDEMLASLARLDQSHARNMCVCLALLALQERKAAILERLLDEDLEITEPFEDEVRRVQSKQDPQTYKLLRDYAARKQRPWATKKRPRHGHPLDWAK